MDFTPKTPLFRAEQLRGGEPKVGFSAARQFPLLADSVEKAG